MSRLLGPLPKTLGSRPRLTRLLLGAVAVVAICLLYPIQTQQTFPYEYQLNEPWKYEDLRAPFEFPILKTDQQYEQDRQIANDRTSLVFLPQTAPLEEALIRFEQAFKRKLARVSQDGSYPRALAQSDQLLAYGKNILNQLYERGIVEANSLPDQSDRLYIKRGNTLQERLTVSVFTPARASAWLSDSLMYTNLAAPDFILPELEAQLQPNLFYSPEETERQKRRTLESVSPYIGVVREGQLIVGQESLVSADVLQRLESYKQQYNLEYGPGSGFNWSLIGYIALSSIIILLLFLYLRYFFPVVYARLPKLVFILLWPVLYALLIRATELNVGINSWVIPFCIVPIVIRIFFTERLAFFVHVIVVLIASFLTHLGYEFTFLHLLAGIVVIVMDIDTRDWSRYFRSLIYLLLVYVGGYFSLLLIKQGNLSNFDPIPILALGANVFLVLLAYPLIPLLERVFGLLSPITLLELGDMNRQLMRDLAHKAPGTLQHSLTVANMAEQAAQRMGADALLLHTAALYHDIGKTANPNFFIENQRDENPHDQLTSLESAKIIIGHVTEGVKMAKKAKLPNRLIDFIRTHHGNTRVEYFYHKHLENNPGGEIDEELFHYPGPRPISREESILMLADSVEAACKSLTRPNEQELTDFIHKIIQGKVNSGQLAQSKLSFRELDVCRDTFIEVMKSVHRPRIAYPENRDNSATAERD
ncbi:MAG: HDIG domain-containing metalloprotein [Bacteroidota bacterium]